MGIYGYLWVSIGTLVVTSTARYGSKVLPNHGPMTFYGVLCLHVLFVFSCQATRGLHGKCNVDSHKIPKVCTKCQCR